MNSNKILSKERSQNKRSDKNDILKSLKENTLIIITYRKKSNNRVITRTVEPYEIKNGFLYAYDRTGRSRNMKSFYMENIISVQKQNREFTPRIF